MEKLLRINQELHDNGKVVMYVLDTNFKKPKIVEMEFDSITYFRGVIGKHIYLYKRDYNEGHEGQLGYNINECFFTEEEARDALIKNIKNEISRLKRLLIWNNATPTTND